MARISRMKVKYDKEGWYHVYCKVAADKDVFPLERRNCRKKLLSLIQFYAKAYFCDIVAFCIMGNHYHLIVRFDNKHTVGKDVLMQRALMLYPNSEKYIKIWDQKKWDRLNERLFDLSEFMRNIQSSFATWYNKTFNHQGAFWADRFKSVLLCDLQSVLDCMIYVELNPVRAGLAVRPEEWQYSSFFLRTIGKATWFLSLEKAFESDRNGMTFNEYRMRLYYRGCSAEDKDKFNIPIEIIKLEEARGFKVSGIYLKRLRYFIDGLAVGSDNYIRESIAELRELGQYKRRINPIRHLDGIHFSIREQRSHAVCF